MNFVDAWNVANITTLLKSSTLIVLGVVPVAVLISTMAAYAIAVLEIPLGRIFYMVLLLTLTLPYEIVIVPLYEQVREMGLLGTQWALILPLIGMNMPFAVFWMRAHFVNVPRELSEAAGIDGAGPWRALRHIHLPLAGPAIASLSLLMFLSTWNQFLLALVLIDDPNKRTMAGALQAFTTKYATDQVLLNAGALLIMAPTILVFLFLQRQVVYVDMPRPRWPVFPRSFLSAPGELPVDNRCGISDSVAESHDRWPLGGRLATNQRPAGQPVVRSH
ncbi:carbohydrate ABC transporter permease [Streptomyces sp. NPDC006385]|uniref:carbohydrate ABC transporter permease n=1 Tax=Streptomyces sp. NPDC006385 TaxID=3156761 RepID=UPI0033BB2F76